MQRDLKTKERELLEELMYIEQHLSGSHLEVDSAIERLISSTDDLRPRDVVNIGRLATKLRMARGMLRAANESTREAIVDLLMAGDPTLRDLRRAITTTELDDTEVEFAEQIIKED